MAANTELLAESGAREFERKDKEIPATKYPNKDSQNKQKLTSLTRHKIAMKRFSNKISE